MKIQNQIAKAHKLTVERSEEWIMERKHFDVHIEGLGENKPHALICVETGQGLVLGVNVIAPDAGDSEVASWALGCMLSPMVGPPRRPASVTLTGGRLKGLRRTLEQVGVSVTEQDDSHPFIDEAVSAMEHDVNNPSLPPYIEGTGLDVGTVGDFFSAAAEFHKLAPWKLFEYETPIRLDFQLKKPIQYWAVVMGAEGQEFGLSLYTSADDLLDMLNSEDDDEAYDIGTSTYSCGFSYESFEDIGAAAKIECLTHGWTLDEGSAYPSVIVVDPGGRENVRRPRRKELAQLTAAVRALSVLFAKYGEQVKEDEDFIRFTTEVKADGNRFVVAVTYPAPEFFEVEEEDFEGEQMNEELHKMMHQVIGNQLAHENPPEAAQAFERLLKTGADRHDCIHAIGRVFAELMFTGPLQAKPFDMEEYRQRLQKLKKVT